MVGLALSLLVIAAPDVDAKQAFRIAYASQYEWSEDDISNATIEFSWERRWVRKDEQSGTSGKGHVVIADGEIARIHVPAATDDQLAELKGHLEWVVARYAREKFEERFKEAKIGKATSAAGGAIRIPVDDGAIFIKNDRIVAREVNYGNEQRPLDVRIDYVVVDMGDGYGIVESRSSFTRREIKTTTTRKLTPRKDIATPSPDLYEHVTESAATGKTTFIVDFLRPKFNEKHPVVVDPEAKRILEEAWAQRWTVPSDLRLRADFKRDVDGELKKRRWTSGVEGKLQVWGMDQIEVSVEEKRVRRGGNIATTCRDHITAYFREIAERPFDEVFEGCGFTQEAYAKGVIIRVLGSRDAEAFRIAKGLIVGKLDLDAGEQWWDYKLKKTRDGKQAIDKATRRFDSGKLQLRFKYTKSKVGWVPKSFDVVGVSGWRTTVHGVVTYKLSRIKVTEPGGE